MNIKIDEAVKEVLEDKLNSNMKELDEDERKLVLSYISQDEDYIKDLEIVKENVISDIKNIEITDSFIEAKINVAIEYTNDLEDVLNLINIKDDLQE